MIGERTAEEIKIKIGSSYKLEQELGMEIRGRDLINGLPKTVKITSEEIREALSEPIGAIVEAVKSVFEKTPPELAADIIDRGIILTGGGALLRGLEKLLVRRHRRPGHRGGRPALVRCDRHGSATTRVIEADAGAADVDDVAEEVARRVFAGGTVVLPNDTSYRIGCDPYRLSSNRSHLRS